MNGEQKLKNIFGSRLKEHISIRDYIALNCGGVVDFFLELDSTIDLISVLTLCNSDKIPFLLIGTGSKVIFSDFGFNGLVIKNNCQSISFIQEKSQVLVDSGLEINKLIMLCASANLGGLEFLVNSSGTVGGAVTESFGGAHRPLYDYVKNITVINQKSEILTFKIKALKGNIKKDKYKILTALLQLRFAKQEEIIRKIRLKKGALKPKPGAISGEIFRDLQAVKARDLILQTKAHRLIVGAATVDVISGNKIINRGSAKSAEIRQLIEAIRRQVAQKTGYVLEEKISYVGVW